MACTKLPLGKNRSGFTLVEILLAIFIFTIVLSLIYTSYTGTFRIINETEYQADIYSMARIALERIYEDLESVYAPKHSDAESGIPGKEGGRIIQFVGEEGEVNGKRGDSLRFISRAHLVLSDEDRPAGTTEIRYSVDEIEEGKALVLYRRDTPSFEEVPDEKDRGLVLCENLQAVSFTYYNADDEAYDNWDSTSGEFKDRIPHRVSVLLEFVNTADPEAPYKFLTTVALPMSGGKQDV